jgi:hypothetical protein
MIELMFEQGNEVTFVVINGKEVKFGSTSYGAQLADISGLKLNYDGVVRVFPDLETHPDWESEAASRFKDHINSLESEDEICEYLIKELEGCGYKAKQKRRDGFRPINL